MNSNRVVPVDGGVRLTFFAALFLSMIFCSTLWAQKPHSPEAKKAAEAASPTMPSGTHELTGADLEAFLDGMMPAQLERENIAGAVIAVVKDGQVIFAKGYGYSDMDKRTPVTPDSTLFRPGSISKLFTWTSVMQLVEQGKLDLNRDVNDYLDFKIPPAYGKPITLTNIMTHTPGFEEVIHDLFVSDAAHMHPLDEYVKTHTPDRIFPPGVVPAYSNYATAVAGYIVQRVSGKPFSQYVQDNILGPLEMTRTTLVQPLPKDLEPMMSKGYALASSPAKPFEFVEAYPAGSVSTTGRDMCNFMIAHLQNGKFGNVQILRPETATLMHARLFGTDDRLDGMAHGFYEESSNGHRIIGHGGDTEYFHSDLHLILDANVGFFVSYNSAGRGEVSPRSILFEKFLDRYFPYTEPPAPKVASADEDAAAVSGLYESSRRFETSFLKLTTLLGENKVFRNVDGTISIDPFKGPNGQLIKYEEISPLLYREVHGRAHVGFKRDATGRMQFQLDWPFFIFQRVGFNENKYFQYFLAIFGLIMVVLTLLFWPIGAIVRKHYARPLDFAPAQRRLRLAVRLACILFLVFFVGWITLLTVAMGSGLLLNDLGPWIILFGVIGVLCLFGTLIVCINALQGWRLPNRWIWTRLYDTALALGCLALIWFAFTWNLMNFNVHY
ncbi:MAG TPA: serine hydrolase [Verrucomicrobiae bacterium]|jgi:CubicO group peptidase (beta-lactamase class C family)|nr:serine hydrolase [Verrucomicrobiae bacterium]